MRFPRLPWWLSPWHACRTALARLAVTQADAQRLARENDRLIQRNSELDARIARLHGPLERTPAGLLVEHNFGYEAPGTDKPEFVIVGADRGNGRGIRLYASRTLAAFSLGMTPENDPPPRFRLRATFGETLVIDKPGYPEAISHWLEIMRNRGNLPLDSPR